MNQKEMKQARLGMAHEVINAMVKEGFTFFSSVFLDSNTATPRNANLRDKDDYDCVDRLFFHYPEKACLVAISVNQWDYKHHDKIHLYINADVMMESADFYRGGLSNYEKFLMKAREAGFVKWAYPHSNWACDKEEFIHLPWFHDFGEEKVSLKLWSHHGGSGSENLIRKRVESSPSRFDGTTMERIADLAENIKVVFPFVKDGSFSTDIPAYNLHACTYDNCDELFFSQFNTRYFRQLMKK
jgi:hypothetical protein